MTYADVMCVYSLESKGESLRQYKCCHEVMHLEQTRAVWKEVRERGGRKQEERDQREDTVTNRKKMKNDFSIETSSGHHNNTV